MPNKYGSTASINRVVENKDAISQFNNNVNSCFSGNNKDSPKYSISGYKVVTTDPTENVNKKDIIRFII